MSIPPHLPGLRIATLFLAIYGLIWISLEGALGQVLVMGVGVTMLTAGHLVQKTLGGRTLTVPVWVGITAVLGLLAGLLSVGMVLAFMAVKTGLHAHGPEFTPAEIAWVMQQWLLWGIVGCLGGTAVGLITVGFADSSSTQ